MTATDIIDREQPATFGTQANFMVEIHYLRGIAAVLVLLYHAGYYYGIAYDDTSYAELIPAYFGLYGVSLFFVISAHLMSSLIKTQSPVEFLYRRLARILPLFIALTVVTLYLGPRGISAFNWDSLLLAPIGRTTYPLAVEWTLASEMFFYVALFVVGLLGFADLTSVIGRVWFGLIIANTVFGWSIPAVAAADVLELPLMPENAPFAAGLAILPALSRWRVNPGVLFLLFLASVAIVITAPLPPRLNCSVAGLGCIFLVAAVVQKPIVLAAPADAILRKLGDWSYALYLVHAPVFLVFLVPAKIEPSASTFALFILVPLLLAAGIGEIDLGLSRQLRTLAKKPLLTLSICSAYISLYLTIAVFYLI